MLKWLHYKNYQTYIEIFTILSKVEIVKKPLIIKLLHHQFIVKIAIYYVVKITK